MFSIDHPVIIENLSFIFNVAYILTIVFIILLIIIENRSPIKSISWILVVTLIPVAGILLYFFFGQKYQKHILLSLKASRYNKRINRLLEKQLKELSGVKPSDIDPELAYKKDIMHLLLRNDKAFLSYNHSVKILNNGSETFPELKRAFMEAKHHIHLDFFIFRFDSIGNELFEILKVKAAQGVEVRIIYDSVGSYHMPKNKKREAKKHGIQLKSFQRVLFPLLSSRVNYRNHRKLVVVDGKTGFTGGLNIADKYLETNPENKIFWRDTFVKIEGKAANALQMVFINDWFYVTKENIFHEKYFLEEPDTTGNLTQIISSGPDSDWHAISQFYFSAITSSRDYIYIASPYFIPNDEISFALKAAALRGIDVRIMIPEVSDTRVSHWSSESYIKEMLKAGIKIYRYRKGFCHSKLLISDDVLCSIGSANLDYRSLGENFEVTAVVYDKKITAKLKQKFFEDLKESVLLNYKLWQKRPWHSKFISSVARLFAPLM
jgi:cardiolipin synthase